MRKILYIDPYCTSGHTNLNKNYIKQLLKVGMVVDIAIKANYIEDLNLPPNMEKFIIPDKLFHHKGKILSRYYLLRIFNYIYRNIELSTYDYIFLAAYDEIALFFSNLKKNLLLLNHSNVAGLNNLIKRYFINKVSKYSTHIVFAYFIKEQFVRYGITNVIVEPVGLIDSYEVKRDIRAILKPFHKKDSIINYEKIIFCPNGSKYSDGFIESLITNLEFIKFLTEEQILFVIKEKQLISKSKNIIILSKRLSDIQYQTLFMMSSVVLLSYPKSFTYRVSAILYECFSNKKICVISDIDSFRSFQSFFNYNPYFKNTNELIQIMKNILGNIDEVSKNPYLSLNNLEPSFIKLLSK